MNQITLTQAALDALPEHHHPPKPGEVGMRWKRWVPTIFGSSKPPGKWFLAEYIEDVPGVREIRISEIVIVEDTEASNGTTLH